MTLFEGDLRAVGGPVTEVFGGVPAEAALEKEFPAAVLSRIGVHESWRKEVHRPATSTHKWWAKRLGSIFRGILAAAVTEDAQAAITAYGSPARLEGLTVFDPFAGSGTIVVEALKLGARAVGWDINPVATLVQRQAVQRWDGAELERAFKLVEECCRPEIDRVHRTEHGEAVLYYFWVAVAACPQCMTDTRLFSTHVFSQNAYPKRVPDAQVVCPVCLDVMPGRYDFSELMCSKGHTVTRSSAVSRGYMACPNGHSSKVIDALAGKPPRYEMYAKLVLGFDGKKRYETVSEFDRSLYTECRGLLRDRASALVLPYGELDHGENTRQAIRWGFSNWRRFFNDRQLYSLGLIGGAIRALDVGAAEREAMAALFSGTLEFNNLFCSFKGEGTGAVRHMFSHHILKPERTPLEAHPWGTPASSGSFSTLFQSRILRAHEYKARPTDQVLRSDEVVRVTGLSSPTQCPLVDSWPESGLSPGTVYLHTGDSSHTDLPTGSVDLVVTDPPYMDNVHYSELADFFHAWLRGLAPYPGYPQELGTTRSVGEVQSPSAADFEQAIAGVWRECARVLKAGGLLAFTFHQARLTGWMALVRALAEAQFVITAVQPIKGEMTTSVTKFGLEPSNLDAVIVCRKQSDVTLSGRVTDPYVAADIGERRLAALISAGIDVGPGDIRSVIRGHVLATYTADPHAINLQLRSELADVLAADRIDLLRAPR
jgi:putative DNA methylase